MNKYEKELMQNLKENKEYIISNSRVVVRNEFVAVFYHSTPVVIIGRKNKNDILFNTGGHYTSTTKSRMNAYLEFNNYNFRVRQIKSKWYFVDNDNKKLKLEYADWTNIIWVVDQFKALKEAL